MLDYSAGQLLGDGGMADPRQCRKELPSEVVVLLLNST